MNGKKQLVFSDAAVLEAHNHLQFLNDNNNEFDLSIYPAIQAAPVIDRGIIKKITGNPIFTTYKVSLPAVSFMVNTRAIGEKKRVVALPEMIPAGLNDIYLTVDYTGDTGMGFINGELVADEFYKGIPWQIGLRKFLRPKPGVKELVLYFRPMVKSATYLIDQEPYPASIPDFGKTDSYLKVNKLSFSPINQQ